MRTRANLRKFISQAFGISKPRPFQGRFRVHTGKSVVVVSTSSSPRILPDLPPEIWTVIIKYAAEVTTDAAVSFFTTPSRFHRTDLRTRLALTLVSRSFNAVARGLLFADIQVHTLEQAYSLLGTAASRGKSIRRLEILALLPPHLEEALVAAAPRLTSFSSINPPSIPLPALAAVLPTITHLALTFSSGTSPCSAYSIPGKVALPFLTSLKLTFTSMTNRAPFTTLAAWSLPALTHLSVLSSDCYYSMPGFAHFFEVHGSRLVQLEIGQPDAYDDDDYHYHAYGGGGNASSENGNQGGNRIPLQRWCPNLREFICSSDAEWNWEDPDWIAPHVLLPTHATLEMIGIKSIHNRITTSLSHHHESPLSVTPFFPLITQFASLLNPDAFPRLRYIRDLSEISAEMRMGTTTQSSSSDDDEQQQQEQEYEAVDDGYDYENGHEDHVPRTTITYAFDPSPSPSQSSSHRPSPYAFPKSSPSAVYAAAAVSPATSSATLSTFEDDDEVPTYISPEDHRRVLKFWASVVRACQARQVWLEDWQGVNVTMTSLRRVAINATS